MPGETSNQTQEPQPQPKPGAKTANQSKNDLSVKLLADIKLAEDILEVARHDGHAVRLAEEEVDGEITAELNTLLQTARRLGHEVVTGKGSKKSATGTEQTAHGELLACLRDLQNRAKRKFPGDRNKLAAYRVGKNNLGASRTVLEQDAEIIINTAEADTLPGLKPEKITAARQKLAAWKKADEDQQKAIKAQATLLREFETVVARINADRRQIQLAADALWPHTDKNNAPTRRAFKLPVGRPMK